MGRTAVARRKDWVEIECNRCNTRYGCLVEAIGTASDSFLPASDKALHEAANYDLRKALEREAATVPCPMCGAYSDDRVETVQRRIGRIVAWPSFFILVIVFCNVIVKIFPDVEGWVMLIVFVASFIGCRILANVARRQANPNRNLEENKKLAQRMVSRGTVRMVSAR